LDLIQENIKIRYQVPYLIQNSIFGYKVKAEFLIKPKFTQISFIQKLLGSSEEGFRFHTTVSYSY